MAKEAPEKKKQRRPSAVKRDIQSKKRREMNRAYKSSVRTAIRRFEEVLTKSDDKDAIHTSLNSVYSLMDKGVKTGVFKLNKASRTKSRMAAQVAAKGSL